MSEINKTKPANQENVDFLDDNMKYLGVTSRDEVHKKGYWHQTFHCWLIRCENKKQYVLFQLRGTLKKLHPNKLDITAAGHLKAGETPADGIRELNEELGLSIQFEELIPLGIRYDIESIGEITNREFCHVYLLESNIPLEAYRLKTDEVTGLFQMELSEGMKLFANEVEAIPVRGIEVDEKGMMSRIEISISKEDIVPRLDSYYLKIFIMAERYFQGKRYLSI